MVTNYKPWTALKEVHSWHGVQTHSPRQKLEGPDFQQRIQLPLAFPPALFQQATAVTVRKGGKLLGYQCGLSCALLTSYCILYEFPNSKNIELK